MFNPNTVNTFLHVYIRIHTEWVRINALEKICAYFWLTQYLYFLSLQGYLQGSRLVGGEYAYLEQCPNLQHSCPTCGQFKVLIIQLADSLIYSLYYWRTARGTLCPIHGQVRDTAVQYVDNNSTYKLLVKLMDSLSFLLSNIWSNLWIG